MIKWLIIFFIIVSGFSFASGVFAQAPDLGVETVGEATGLSAGVDLRVTIGNIIRIILGFVGVIAIVLVLYGGFVYMTSGGEEAKVAKAKKILINSFIGLAIVFSAYAITSFVISRLSEATGLQAGPGVEIQGAAPIGGLQVANVRSFVGRSISPSTELKVRNVKVRINFSSTVNSRTINDQTVKIIDKEGNAVAGDFVVIGSKVVFTPSEKCPAPNDNLKCFGANTEYSVSLVPTEIKSTGGKGLSCAPGSVCRSDFTTGENVDVTAPQVSFTSPLDGAKVSVNDFVDMNISAVDDSGISAISFSADGELVAEEGKDGATPRESSFEWDTADLAIGMHTLEAKADDVDDHSATKQIRVKVLPESCFEDGVAVCGRAECGACDGACRDDVDCASGYYCAEQGVDEPNKCIALPVITNVTPDESATGNLVSVYGSGFKNFVAGTSKVYFTGGLDSDNNPVYIEAEMGCADNFAWSDRQVIAKVPEGATDGPIKIVNKDNKYDDTINDRGWKKDFVINETLTYPGLCSVAREDCVCEGAECSNCLAGDLRQSVVANGTNFGSSNDPGAAEYRVYFGENPTQLSAGAQWTRDRITKIQIPNLKSGLVNVSVSQGERCINVDNKECEKGTDGCVCTFIVSNPVRFRISVLENLPEIKEISPSPAPQGQIITLSGENFGTKVGWVELLDAAGEKTNAGLGCENNSWNDSEVKVKISDTLPAGTYGVVLVTSDAVRSEPKNLAVNEESAGPAICSISPDNGPRGILVDLSGQNFGAKANYTLKFAKTGVADDPGIEVTETAAWANTAIKKARIPAEAVSGKVYVENNDNAQKSNEVHFTVGSCSGESCGEGRICCATGICANLADGCVAPAEGADSEFAWIVSTGSLPKVPKILERSCTRGYLPQSPSPFRGSIDACPNGMISGTFNMIINSATLNNNITIKKCEYPLRTLRCEENKSEECVETSAACTCTVDLGQCDLDKCEENCITQPVGAIDPNDIGTTNESAVCLRNGSSCAAGTPNCECEVSGKQLTEFHLARTLNKSLFKGGAAPIAEGPRFYANLFKNTLYKVEIKGGADGIATEKGEFMPRDYSWQFRTLPELCSADTLLMKPIKGLIDSLDDTESFMVSGQYQCQDISLMDENWRWTANDPRENSERVSFQRNAFDEDGLRKDIGIFGLSAEAKANPVNLETTVDELVGVRAYATIATDSMIFRTAGNVSKDAQLEIKFADPKVVSYFPACDEACINAGFGADFNIQMKSSSLINVAVDGSETLNTDNVKLFACRAGADCVTFDEVDLAGSIPNYQFELDAEGKLTNRLTVNPSNELLPNKFYRVVISGNTQSASGVDLTGLNYSTALAEQGTTDSFSWVFKTKNTEEKCRINSVSVMPQSYLSETKEQRISYSALPRSAPDACDPEGQILNQYDYTWAWMSGKPNVATISDTLYHLGLPEFCTDKCLSRGSGSLASVCGNGIRESGEECDVIDNIANGDGCSANCLREAVPNLCTGAENEKCCGNGREDGTYSIEDIAYTEECDFACQFLKDGEACDPEDEDAGCVCVAKDPACTAGCLKAGTAAGFVCGNGIVEEGEDCDDGNTSNGDGCSNKCLNEGSKYKKGEPAASALCGNGELEGGEECEAICKNANNSACAYGVQGCVCSLADNPDCNERCLWRGFTSCIGAVTENCCGNGTIDGNEECESECKKADGSGCVYGVDQGCVCRFPSYCNGKCLNQGSSVEAGSACGDGIVGSGEDDQCEPGGQSIGQSPYQSATVVGNIDILNLYDPEKHYAQDSTDISATGTETGDNPISKTGTTELTFRDRQCVSPDIRMDVNNIVPARNSAGVCRNALIYIPFNKKIGEQNISTNIKLFYLSAEACPAETAMGFFQRLKLALKNLLAKVTFAQEAYLCRIEIDNVSVESTGEQNPADRRTAIMITPKQALPAGKQILVVMDDMTNICGDVLGQFTTQFSTGNEVCKLDQVSLDPDYRLILDQDHVEDYRAIAKSKGNLIQAIPGVYDWRWEWRTDDSSIVGKICSMEAVEGQDEEVCNVVQNGSDKKNKNEVKVTTTAKNGETQIHAKAVITVDKLGLDQGGFLGEIRRVCRDATQDPAVACAEGAENCVCADVNSADSTGAFVEGAATIEMMICENPWSPEHFEEDKWDLLEYETGTGTKVPVHLNEKEYNVGLFYCRDFGEGNDTTDDLPKLKESPAVAIPPNRFAIKFDQNDKLRIPYTDALQNKLDFSDFSKPWTIESLIYVPEPSGQVFQPIFTKNLNCEAAVPGGCPQILIGLFPIQENGRLVNKVYWNLRYGQLNSIKLQTTQSVSAGYHAISVVYDGEHPGGLQYQIFIDGERSNFAASSFPVAGVSQNKDIYVGSSFGTPDRGLNGYLEDFRIWKTARTTGEIIANQYVLTDQNDPNLIVHLDFEHNLKNSDDQQNAIGVCTGDDHCSGGSFNYVNLFSQFGSDVGAAAEQVRLQSENQCRDGIDNDRNGLIDFPDDKKCVSADDPAEEPKLLAQYFFTPDGIPSADVISLRIYENPEALPPDVWYQNYAPNPAASTSKVEVDCDLQGNCYAAAQDGSSIYISAANISANKTVYNNIYLLGYSRNSGAETMNIYSQMVKYIKFNLNRDASSDPDKSQIIRDTKRISDMVLMRIYLENYKNAHGNKVPMLESGSYVRGQTFSVWPSWQGELGRELGAELPRDPENHFKWETPAESGDYTGEICSVEDETPILKCPDLSYQCAVPGFACVNCAQGYNGETCYNSSNQLFANIYAGHETDHPVYSYKASASGLQNCYELKYRLETNSDGYTYNYSVVPGLAFPVCK